MPLFYTLHIIPEGVSKMNKIKAILSFALTVCCYFSFQNIIYGADEYINTNVNSRFFQISTLMIEEHKRLGLPTTPEKDIEVLCEERTFDRIRKEYKMAEALTKIESHLHHRQDLCEIAVGVVKSVFESVELIPLMNNHARSYFMITGIPFMKIYQEEYELLKSQKPSYIASLAKYPDSKKVFDVLARDMKEDPSLLDSFLKEYLENSPEMQALKAEIVEYVKAL